MQSEMQMNDMILVSIDDHFIEPPDMYANHVPQKWLDEVPKVVRNEHGIDEWVFQGQRTSTPFGMAATVGWPREQWGFNPGAYSELRPGCFDVHERVAWLEVDLDTLLRQPHGERKYRLVSRYPSSDLDLAFEVDETTAAAEVEEVIRSAGGDLVTDVELFDVFRGDAVAKGRRSLAYTLRLQAPDRTLTDEELAAVRQRVIDAVERALPAKLRG